VLEDGAILGAASPMLGKAARSIYGSKRIINPKAEPMVQEQVLERLINEGHIGGEPTFRDVAEKAKGSYGSILEGGFQPIYKKGQNYDFEDVMSGLNDRIKGKKDFALMNDMNELENRKWAALFKLGRLPKAQDINNYLSQTNTEMAPLSDRQRLYVLRYAGSRSPPAELESMGARKNSLKDWQRRALEQEHGQAGAELYDKANKEYAFGKELEKALKRPPSLQETVDGLGLPLASGASTAYGVSQAAQGKPGALAAAALGTAGIVGSKSLPVRTAVGVPFRWT